MESDKNRKRIILLFCVLLVMVFFSALYGCMDMYYGHNGRERALPDGRYEKIVGSFYTRSGGFDNQNYDIPITVADGGDLQLSAKNIMICVKAEYAKGMQYRERVTGIIYQIMTVMRFIVLILLMAAIVCLSVNVIRGFKTQDFFKKSNVVWTRSIGWLTVIFFVVDSLSEYFNQLSLMRSGLLDGTGYEINYYFVFNRYSFIAAIVLFIFAELFSVGYRMNEEQKMTI